MGHQPRLRAINTEIPESDVVVDNVTADEIQKKRVPRHPVFPNSNGGLDYILTKELEYLFRQPEMSRTICDNEYLL